MKRLWLLAVLLPLLVAGDARKQGGGIVSGSQGSNPTGGGALSYFYETCNPDDCPGIADGAGADPNPFTASRASQIAVSSSGNPFTNAVDHVHCITSYNQGILGCDTPYSPSTTSYGSGMQFEYSFDQALRSGMEMVEWLWSIDPATHTVAFNSDIDAAVGSCTAGDNITFTGGEICRATLPAGIAVALPGTCRLTCNAGDAPEDNDVITACTSGCDGTVNGVPTSERTAFRPWFFSWRSDTNQAGLTVRQDATNIMLQGSAGAINLGWDGGTVTSMVPRVPAGASPGGVFAFVGGLGFDTTASQLLVGDGTSANAVSHRNQACAWYDTNTTTANVPLRFLARQPITVLGLGCSNVVGSPAANPTITANTFSDGAANAATHAQVDCADLNATITYQAVTGTNTFAAGESMNFDIVQGTATTDDVVICIEYMETRQ